MYQNSKYPRSNGIEVYIKDKSNKEIYIISNNCEKYSFNYIKKREVYAVDEFKIPYYAKRNNIEIYAIDFNRGFEIFVSNKNEQIYAIDEFKNQIYPLNLSRKEKVARKNYQDKNNYTYFYKKLSNGDEVYPRDEHGNQYIIQDKGDFLIALAKDGSPIAPKFSDGKVKYIIKDNKEYLYKYKNNLFFGQNSKGEQVYPLNESSNEYYPIENSKLMIAKNASGIFKYALDKLNNIIYPMDISKNEFYLQDDNGDSFHIIDNQINNFIRYCISGSDFIYPQKYTKNGLTDIMIDDMYAEKLNIETSRYELVYPKDEFLNEFTTCDLHDDYPVTSDGYIILSNINNEPIVMENDEKLKEHIRSLLYKPNFNSYYFLTDIKGRTTNLIKKTNYQTINLINHNTAYRKYYYIVGSLLILILFLILTCIFI